MKLQYLICERCINKLGDLLDMCGADKTEGHTWCELKEAIFTHNGLKEIDNSLQYVPWLNTLDLSNNLIEDGSPLSALMNLKYLNLSFNKLTRVPLFTGYICRRLQKDDAKAASLLASAVNRSVAELVLTCNNAKEIWDKLHARFDNFKDIWDTIPSENQKLNLLIEKLCTIELRDQSSTEESVFVASGKRKQFKKDKLGKSNLAMERAKQKFPCNKCKQVGHWAAECPQKKIGGSNYQANKRGEGAAFISCVMGAWTRC
ncbi:Leucine Rich repeats (2 copies) [Popillia japonica]